MPVLGGNRIRKRAPPLSECVGGELYHYRHRVICAYRPTGSVQNRENAKGRILPRGRIHFVRAYTRAAGAVLGARFIDYHYEMVSVVGRYGGLPSQIREGMRLSCTLKPWVLTPQFGTRGYWPWRVRPGRAKYAKRPCNSGVYYGPRTARDVAGWSVRIAVLFCNVYTFRPGVTQILRRAGRVAILGQRHVGLRRINRS